MIFIERFPNLNKSKKIDKKETLKKNKKEIEKKWVSPNTRVDQGVRYLVSNDLIGVRDWPSPPWSMWVDKGGDRLRPCGVEVRRDCRCYTPTHAAHAPRRTPSDGCVGLAHGFFSLFITLFSRFLFSLLGFLKTEYF
jgi:hypothetical protein